MIRVMPDPDRRGADVRTRYVSRMWSAGFVLLNATMHVCWTPR